MRTATHDLTTLYDEDLIGFSDRGDTLGNDDGGCPCGRLRERGAKPRIRRDVERLTAQWTEIEEKVAKGSSSAPMLLHGEPDLAIKVVRDIFNEDFGKLVVEGDAAWTDIESYVTGVAPDLADRIQLVRVLLGERTASGALPVAVGNHAIGSGCGRSS